MKTRGLRICEIRDSKCIPLSELLENMVEIRHLNWALLWCNVMLTKGSGEQVIELENKVNTSKHGIVFTFEELLVFSRKIFQEIELLIVGCEQVKQLHRYPNDQAMYEACDVVIEMIDGGFWEIFSKKNSVLDKLSKKYKNIEFLESDFQNT